MVGDVVFVSVVVARFVVPLAIPRFPLPAIIIALAVDAADQTILHAVGAEPPNYQAYDKALDIYYLTVAYASTIRNWPEPNAFRIGQMLWYYRLVGVVSFELTGVRALLLIFPNTFEYFFIMYEVVRVRWDPRRLKRRALIVAAAAIWAGIKLPQEWWLHVARLDLTDVIGSHPWLWPLLAAALAGVWLLAMRLWADRLPGADWRPSFDVDRHGTTAVAVPVTRPMGRWVLINHPLVEKTLLTGLVVTVFLQLIPSTQVGLIDATLGTGVVVVGNSFVGHWLQRRGVTWTGTAADFLATAAINVGVVLSLEVWSSGRGGGSLDASFALFLLALLTLIVGLYDRYRSLRIANPRSEQSRSVGRRRAQRVRA